MNYYIMETAAWLLAAFFLGAMLGCILKNLLSRKPEYAGAGTVAAGAGAATGVAINRMPPSEPESVPQPPVQPPVQPSVDERIAKADRVAVRRPEPVDPRPLPPVHDQAVSDVDLKRIRAIGPDMEIQLNKLGVSSYEQIASWSSGDVARITSELNLSNRIERENWIEQAAVLAKGGHTLFSRRVGRGEYLSVNAAAYDAPYDGDALTPHVSHVPAQTVDSDEVGIDVAHIDADEARAAPAGPVDLTKGAIAAGVAATTAGIASDKVRGDDDDAAELSVEADDAAAVQHDDFKKIEGIGPAIEKTLVDNGAVTYADIAAWKRPEVDYVNSLLEAPGRVERENWIEQAAVLALGRESHYSKRVVAGTTVAPLTEEDVELYDAALITDEEVAEAIDGSIPAGSPNEPQPFAPEERSGTGVVAAGVAAAAGGAAAIASEFVQKRADAGDSAGSAAVAPEPPAPSVIDASLRFDSDEDLSDDFPWKPSDFENAPKPAPVPADDAVDLQALEDKQDRISDSLSEEIEEAAEEGHASDAGERLDELEDELEASVADFPPVPAAPVTPGASAPVTPVAPEPDTPRDRSGLRSVRSEALIGQEAARNAYRPGAAGQGDDLKRIRGIGVLVERKLNAMGVSRYADIAAWSDADVERVNSELDFMGRIERENWVEQARLLARGSDTDFSRRVDRGDITIPRPVSDDD